MVEGHPQNQISGLTIIEVMVAMGLITMALMMVLSLIPAGIRASHQAQSIELAVAWSAGLIEETPLVNKLPIPAELAQSSFQQELQGVRYSATRTVENISPFLYEIKVHTDWPGSTRPIDLNLIRFSPELSTGDHH